MAKNSVADWDTDSDNNTDIGGTNIGEGCAPSGINNAIRKVMAQAKAGFAPIVHVHANATTSVAGFMSATDKTRIDALWPVTSSTGEADLDTFITPGWCKTLVNGSWSNGWGVAEYGHLLVLEHSGGQLTQVVFPYASTTSKTIRWRGRFAGVWSSWVSASIDGHVHAAATTSVAGFMSATDKTKLDGIAAGATANSSNATLLARANHTGTQAISTVTGLQTALDGKAATSHNHSAADITSGTLTIARGGTGQTTEAGMRGVYTGSSASNTDFPIGTTIIVKGSAVARNAAAVPYTHPSDTSAFQVGSGGALSGTWRARGCVGDPTDFMLLQRVA